MVVEFLQGILVFNEILKIFKDSVDAILPETNRI